VSGGHDGAPSGAVSPGTARHCVQDAALGDAAAGQAQSAEVTEIRQLTMAVADLDRPPGASSDSEAVTVHR